MRLRPLLTGLVFMLGGALGPVPVVRAAPDAGSVSDAQLDALLERGDLCLHFAGEINGDGSAHDREIAAKMRSLRCEHLVGELKAMQARLPAAAPKAAHLRELIESF